MSSLKLVKPDVILYYPSMEDVHARLTQAKYFNRAGDQLWKNNAFNKKAQKRVVGGSTLWRMIKIGLNVAPSPATALNPLVKKPGNPRANWFAWQKRAGKYPFGWFRDKSVEKVFEENDTTRYQKALTNLICLAKENGTRILLTTFLSSPEFPQQPWVSSKEYKSAIKEMNEAIRKVASQNAVGLFDLANIFPKHPRRFIDGWHLRSNGKLIMGEMCAKYLIKNKVIPKKKIR